MESPKPSCYIIYRLVGVSNHELITSNSFEPLDFYVKFNVYFPSLILFYVWVSQVLSK